MFDYRCGGEFHKFKFYPDFWLQPQKFEVKLLCLLENIAVTDCNVKK